MGLNRQLIHSKPCGKPTKEEQKECDLAWQIFCEKGHVSITNPLATEDKEESLKELLKRDPNAFFRAGCDFNSDLPYDEFYRRVMAGEYDAK